VARELFGPEVVVVPADTPPTAELGVGQPFTAWSDRTGGTDFTTELRTPDGITTLDPVADSNGMIPWFRGPESVKVVYIDAGGGTRFPLFSVESLTAVLTSIVSLTADQTWTGTQNFDGPVDFAANPTVNGSPLTGGTGSGLTDGQITTKIGGDWTNLVPLVTSKADLDPATGKVPTSQLPAASGGAGSSRVYRGIVASQTAMLALPALPGDWCKRSDEGNAAYECYASPATAIGNWTKLATNTETYGSVLPGARFDVFKNGDGTWPARPSARTDIHFDWRGTGTDYPSGWLTGDERIRQA
jgi:hypothetical protein